MLEAGVDSDMEIEEKYNIETNIHRASDLTNKDYQNTAHKRHGETSNDVSCKSSKFLATTRSKNNSKNTIGTGYLNAQKNNVSEKPNYTLGSILKEIDLYDELYGHFKENDIDCECMLNMNEKHIDELMNAFSMRIKIIFEHRLRKWRKIYENKRTNSVSLEIYQGTCKDGWHECQLLSVEDKNGTSYKYHLPKTNNIIDLPNRLMEAVKSSLDAVLQEYKKMPEHETNQCTQMEHNDVGDEDELLNETEVNKNDSDKLDILKSLTPRNQIVNNHILEPSDTYNKKRKWGLETEVKEILQMYKSGNTVLESYQFLGAVTPEMRTELVHTLVDHFVINHEYLSVVDCNKLAKEIVELFPTECLDTYFLKEFSSCTPRGKLWDRYQNRRQKHKKTLNSLLTSPQPSCVYTKPDHDDMELMCGLLKLVEDEKQLLKKWNKSFHFRRYQLQSGYFENWKLYFDEYPFCKQPSYSQFIDADLDVLYPNLKFDENLWLDFINNFKVHYWNRITHGKSRELFDELMATEDVAEKSEYFEVKIIELLHAVLNCSQDVIEEAQRQFTIEVPDLGELKKIVIERKKLCVDHGIQCKPYIAVVGQNHCYEHFSVVIDSTGYSCDSYQEAITLCFKLYLFFDLCYTKETFNSWIFIQKYFFNRHSIIKNDVVDSFILDVRSQKQIKLN